MKILYAALKYARNVVPPTFSIEHINFYSVLEKFSAVELIYYPLERANEIGFENVSAELNNLARKERPDVLMLVSFNHDLDKKVFKQLKQEKITTTVGIFFDEDTDLYQRSLGWAPYLDWVVTFYPPAWREYKKREFSVIGTDWFINLDFYKPSPNIERDIDVSFIGAAKSERKKLAEKLLRQGIKLEAWGPGWPNGPVDSDRMTVIFNRSKINLNLGYGKSILRWQTPLRVLFSPSKKRRGFEFDPRHVVGNLRTILNRRNPQCRARVFEIMACRTFLLTNRAPLFNMFKEGSEMVYYDDRSGLVRKIQYYLNHSEEREAIAKAAYERVARDNSAAKRLHQILEIVSSKSESEGIIL